MSFEIPDQYAQQRRLGQELGLGLRPAVGCVPVVARQAEAHESIKKPVKMDNGIATGRPAWADFSDEDERQ